MKIDILFIHPNASKKIYQELSKEHSAIETPIWAGMLAKHCEINNFNVEILDCEAMRLNFEQSAQTISDLNPKIACFVVYGQQPSASSQNMAGAVAISDDGIPLINSQVLRMALEYAKKFNIPIINHAEDIALVNEGLMHEGLNSLKLGLPGNPDISESTMVYRDLSIAEYVGGKIHVPHVSTAKSVEVIKRFKKKGIKVTSEVTPHHLCLTDKILLKYDTNAKVAPPIRSKYNKDALIAGIKEGIINCIATDHAPHSIEDKEKDFKNASCGMLGLESAFGLVNKTLQNENMKIEQIIDLFTINPSKIMNIIPNSIKEGNIAELNVINQNKEWIFRNDDIQSKSSNSPLINYKLKGKILITINKGFISGSMTK